MALIPEGVLNIPGLDDFVKGIERQAGGLFLLPTDAGRIPTIDMNLDGLYRDAEGIVMQYQVNDATPAPDDFTLDGGDSAHRTGTLSFCGSAADQALLGRFENGGVMVRHPTQEPWQNANNCSRDQLIAYMAGLWRSGKTDIAGRLLHATEVRQNTCQNFEADKPGTVKNPRIGDPVFPHHHMFLKVCAGQKDAHFDVIGQFFLQADIEAAAHRTDEINQLLLCSIVCCRLDYLVAKVPNYQDRLNEYWGGWRKQQQIADALGAVVRTELERYKGFIGFSFPPLPMATLNAVAKVIEDAWKAISEGKLPPVLNITDLEAMVDSWKPLLGAALQDYEQQVRYYLDLAPKLFDAAQRLNNVQALGGLLLNPLGILGGQSGADTVEIRRALERIDGKISQVLTFLRRDFGPAVKAEVDASLAGYALTQCSEKIRNEVMPWLTNLSASPVPADVDIKEGARTLRDICADVVNLCNTSVRLHGALAPLACGVYATIVRASSLLLRISFAEHHEFVKAWCRSMRAALQEVALNGANTKSLTYASTQLPSKVAVDAAHAYMPAGTPQITVYWGLTIRPEMVGGTQVWRANAYGALLFAFTDQYGWQIDDNPRVNDLTDDPNRTNFLPVAPHNNYYLQPWWPLSINFNGYWEDEGKRMKATADTLMRQSIRRPARYALDEAITTVNQVVAEVQRLEQDIIGARG